MKYDPEKWLRDMHCKVPSLKEAVPRGCLAETDVLGMQARVLGSMFIHRDQTHKFNIHQLIDPYREGRPNVTKVSHWWNNTSAREIFPCVDLVRKDIWGRGTAWWSEGAVPWSEGAVPKGWRQGRVAIWPRCPVFTKEHCEQFLIGAEATRGSMPKVMKGRVKEAVVFLLVNLIEKPYAGFVFDLCRRTSSLGYLEWLLDMAGATGYDEKMDGRHYVWASPWRTPERDSVLSGVGHKGGCTPFVAIIPDIAIRRRLHQKVDEEARWSWARGIFNDVAVLQSAYANAVDLPRMKNKELARAVQDMVLHDDLYRRAVSVTPTGLHDFPILLFGKKWESRRER